MLNEMQWKTTNHLVQVNYLGELMDPSFPKSRQLEKKILHRDLDHQKRMIVERAQPFLSPNFELKELQANYWSERVDIHKDAEYQKLSLAEKKLQEEREVKKRIRDYWDIRAEIIFNQNKNEGIDNYNETLYAMLMRGV